MRWVTVVGALLLFTIAARSAEQVPPGKAAEFDGKKWVERIRSVVFREGWSVRAQGQDIIVERNQPTPMITIYPNQSIDTLERIAKERRDHKQRDPGSGEMVRLVLKFAPRMSLDEYERLASINAASYAEIERLQTATKLHHKGAIDSMLAVTPEEKMRLRQFKEAVAKLPRHDLPDMYSTDHSVRLLLSWGMWSHVSDPQVAEECQEVQESLVRYFGVYNPRAAASSGGVGRYQPDLERVEYFIKDKGPSRKK